MDGPVVKAAEKALRTGNLNHVLIWVQARNEPEIRKLFVQARKVRVLGPDAAQLADTYFYETVVRVHRAGEGEPYTGLKPSGTEATRIFFDVDNAIASNSVEKLLSRFPANERADLNTKFRDVVTKKGFNVNDVKAGREYVASYVAFLHWVEKLEGHDES